MSGDYHYGIRYPSGFVADFETNRDLAVSEYQTLALKGALGVRLVQRKVGPWHPARAQGGNR